MSAYLVMEVRPKAKNEMDLVSPMRSIKLLIRDENSESVIDSAKYVGEDRVRSFTRIAFKRGKI